MPDDTTYPVYKQQFEVVLMRNGVTEQTAKLEDFVRISALAKDPLAACLADDVLAKAKEGYSTIGAVLPGELTGQETMARRRVVANDAVQRTNW